jgi:hypothetical protein
MGVLVQRMSLWAENTAILADNQYGFRPHRGTLHPGFILQHLVDKVHHTPGSGYLYAAFIDISKAYDSLSRPVIFAELHRKGCPQPMITFLQRLYADTTCTVKLQNQLGSPFPVNCGVRQGCPLSPLLFNIVLADLPHYLSSTYPFAHVPLDGLTTINSLLYADDVALLTSTPHQLQNLLTATQTFCASRGLTISPQKSCVVVFGKRTAVDNFQWTVNSAPIPRTDQVTYLGLALHATHSTSAFMCTERAKLGTKAVHHWHEIVYNLHLPHDLGLSLDLIDIVIKPSLSYGSPLFGPALVDHTLKHTTNADSALLDVLRSVLQLSRGVPSHVIFRETHTSPLHLDWLLSAVQFYNSCLTHNSSLLKAALHDNLIQAFQRQHACWAAHLASAIQKVCQHSTQQLDHWVHALKTMQPISRAHIQQHYLISWHDHIAHIVSDPRHHQCPHRHLSQYYKWFDQHLHWQPRYKPWYMRNLCATSRQLRLCHFTCGNEDVVPANDWRLHTQHVEGLYSCSVCGHEEVPDQYHVLMQCVACRRHYDINRYPQIVNDQFAPDIFSNIDSVVQEYYDILHGVSCV